MLTRALVSIFGAVLFVYGMLAAFSPLPLGAPLVILGFLMIAAANPAFRPLLRRLRKRWPWFNALVLQVGKRTPDRFDDMIDDVIDETTPTPEDDPEKDESTKPAC